MGYLFIYVNDIVIVREDDNEVDRLEKNLASEFPIRDLGQLKFFLGIQVTHLKEGIHLSWTHYIVNLLRSCEMEHLKPAPTPMLPNLDLMSEEPLITDSQEFRRIIDSLQYVTLTRPNV